MGVRSASRSIALIGGCFIHVDSDFLYYFKPSSTVRTDNETINQTIVGSNPFYLVIESNEARRDEALGGPEAGEGPADVPR